jgi:hypothetical protein
MSPSSCHLNNKYTNIEVLINPVGKTKILFCLEYQTEANPKNTAVISIIISKTA